MKKLLKIIFGILLILGCSGGVLLDNSGHFVKNAMAISHTFDATTLPDGGGSAAVLNGTKVEALTCKLDEDKIVYVTHDGGQKLKMYHKSKATGCKALLDNIYDNLKGEGFIITFQKSAISGDSYNASSNATPSNDGDNPGGSTSTPPKMNVLTWCEGKEGEESVKCVLNLIINIMTYGIGVLGVVGIVLSGIQYITSQGDPAKMTKAKNRIIQVVIGLVIYAVMYAALMFLVPGFSPNL